MKNNNKTLSISVCEIFNVNYIEDIKVYIQQKYKFIFELFTESLITLIKSVQILSRPPTVQFNFLTLSKNHLDF